MIQYIKIYLIVNFKFKYKLSSIYTNISIIFLFFYYQTLKPIACSKKIFCCIVKNNKNNNLKVMKAIDINNINNDKNDKFDKFVFFIIIFIID